jgi:hypothetical protein
VWCNDYNPANHEALVYNMCHSLHKPPIDYEALRVQRELEEQQRELERQAWRERRLQEQAAAAAAAEAGVEGGSSSSSSSGAGDAAADEVDTVAGGDAQQAGSVPGHAEQPAGHVAEAGVAAAQLGDGAAAATSADQPADSGAEQPEASAAGEAAAPEPAAPSSEEVQAQAVQWDTQGQAFTPLGLNRQAQRWEVQRPGRQQQEGQQQEEQEDMIDSSSSGTDAGAGMRACTVSHVDAARWAVWLRSAR